MRRLLPALLLILATITTFGQVRQAPPTFEPGDTEGLIVSPNPRIRHAWKRKVFWRVTVQPPRLASPRIPAHTAAERQQMTASLDALTGLLRATPTGSTGEGFWVSDSRTFDYFDLYAAPVDAPLAKYPLQFGTGLFPFRHEDIQSPNGSWRTSVAGETESVYFTFNQLPGTVDQPVIAVEPQTGNRTDVELYLRPRVTARVAGLPLYEKQALVVARRGRDPWAPVSVGRALKAVMGALQKDRKTAEDRLAGLKKKNDGVQAAAWEQEKRDRFEKDNGELRTSRPSNYEARRRSLENEITYTRTQAAADANPGRDDKGAWYWNPLNAHDVAARRLAALTADEAAKPACLRGLTSPLEQQGRYTMKGTIEAAGADEACREIVTTNHAYFDVSLPRATPQLLLISQFGRCVAVNGDQLTSAPVTRFDSPAQGCVQHAGMWREVDWTKIAALVKD